MDKSNQSSGELQVGTDQANKDAKSKSMKSNNGKMKTEAPSTSDQREVLLQVGGLKYRMPGKNTRVILGSVVLGLNVLLVLAVGLYFYVPAFQEFIFNIGRN